MREGKGASIMDYFGTLEDPRIDRCKRRQLVGHHSHCHLRRHLRRRLLGLHRIVRQEQAGMVPDLPGTAPRHPVPRHLRRRLLPVGPGAVPAVLHGLDPGGVRPGPQGSGVQRRQDGTAFPRPQCGQAGHPPGQRLGLGQHADPGAGEDHGEVHGEVQRNHRHPPVAANAGTEGVHRHHRRHGLPAGDRQGILDRGAGYVLALQENQGQLYEDVRDRFEGAAEFGFGGVPHDYPPP